MITDRSSIASDERGASLVEMALVTVLLLTLLAGVADLGRAFYSYIAVTNASREGARYASRFPDDATAIGTATIAEASNFGVALQPGDIAVTGLNGTGGNPIIVTVDFRLNTILGAIIGRGQIPMRRSTEMIIFGL